MSYFKAQWANLGWATSAFSEQNDENKRDQNSGNIMIGAVRTRLSAAMFQVLYGKQVGPSGRAV